jgi:hypothetical protein
MNITDAFPSNYLKKEDFMQPRQLTIDSVKMENISHDDKPAEIKLVMYFNGAPKPMIVNKTVATVLGAMLGNETDHWPSNTVEVFNDVTVVYNGAVGGIRIRPVQQVPIAQPVAQQVSQPPTFDDDIPGW